MGWKMFGRNKKAKKAAPESSKAPAASQNKTDATPPAQKNVPTRSAVRQAAASSLFANLVPRSPESMRKKPVVVKKVEVSPEDVIDETPVYIQGTPMEIYYREFCFDDPPLPAQLGGLLKPKPKPLGKRKEVIKVAAIPPPPVPEAPRIGPPPREPKAAVPGAPPSAPPLPEVKAAVPDVPAGGPPPPDTETPSSGTKITVPDVSEGEQPFTDLEVPTASATVTVEDSSTDTKPCPEVEKPSSSVAAVAQEGSAKDQPNVDTESPTSPEASVEEGLESDGPSCSLQTPSASQTTAAETESEGDKSDGAVQSPSSQTIIWLNNMAQKRDQSPHDAEPVSPQKAKCRVKVAATAATEEPSATAARSPDIKSEPGELPQPEYDTVSSPKPLEPIPVTSPLNVSAVESKAA